ncbi:hypothetical protein [Brachyspira hyodysenteriae]|uniref:hypothetical protein n=1 Tax=Brachyspira hyodysenteriae TaxID=159 RepID=UPI00063DB047|nr:hypothetical protein [Brachyspira hyodysenteriae]KLI13516.1 hypothetical protein SU45_13450 [Brachyspira hyodysenteriae]KLI59446.1 hypothetical protein SZ46_08830 [Brachyspira hyodysenteriae]
MTNLNKNKLLTSILKKYFNSFFDMDSNIKLIKQDNYYIIYFMNKASMDNKINIIEDLFERLDNRYKNILSYLDLFIGYDYIYNFYVNEEDLIEQEKNGLCNDLTFKLLQDYSAIEKTKSKILSILLDCYLETVKEFRRRIIYDKKNMNISISDCNIKVENKKEYDNINNYEENDEYCEAA